MLPLIAHVLAETRQMLAAIDVAAYTRGPELAGVLRWAQAWFVCWRRRWARNAWQGICSRRF